MEYYNSETCLMEELLLAKDMEYYANVEDLNYTLNNLDSCLPTNHNNITSSSSSNAHCSFQDYSNFPINVDIQTFNFPISYELQGDQFTQLQCSPNTNFHDFQQDYSSINYADDSKLEIDQAIVIGAPCKDEPVPENESKNKMKKVSGQPSKNLMAERRRRKRLNDRLSMLRSVVPKISKMDRTSILGDTIDYMKELLERINNLQEELTDEGRGAKAKAIVVRNSPKMEVEKMRGNGETRIKIRCAMKPGLLLSSMKTVEELGLEIQQCVISCFSDFTMQASCSQEEEEFIQQQEAEQDIKQALFRNINNNSNVAGISYL